MGKKAAQHIMIIIGILNDNDELDYKTYRSTLFLNP